MDDQLFERRPARGDKNFRVTRLSGVVAERDDTFRSGTCKVCGIPPPIRHVAAILNGVALCADCKAQRRDDRIRARFVNR